MTIKNYTFSLEKEVVDKSKDIAYSKSQKLSPIVNILLKKWLEENKEPEPLSEEILKESDKEEDKWDF